MQNICLFFYIIQCFIVIIIIYFLFFIVFYSISVPLIGRKEISTRFVYNPSWILIEYKQVHIMWLILKESLVEKCPSVTVNVVAKDSNSGR